MSIGKIDVEGFLENFPNRNEAVKSYYNKITQQLEKIRIYKEIEEEINDMRCWFKYNLVRCFNTKITGLYVVPKLPDGPKEITFMINGYRFRLQLPFVFYPWLIKDIKTDFDEGIYAISSLAYITNDLLINYDYIGF